MHRGMCATNNWRNAADMEQSGYAPSGIGPTPTAAGVMRPPSAEDLSNGHNRGHRSRAGKKCLSSIQRYRQATTTHLPTALQECQDGPAGGSTHHTPCNRPSSMPPKRAAPTLLASFPSRPRASVGAKISKGNMKHALN